MIEAHESGVPLIVLSADRPPELRDCASGQTINQVGLFGDRVNYFHELAVPEATESRLRYLRQTIAHAVDRTLRPGPGPVHLNLPFRDPLPPIADGGSAQARVDMLTVFDAIPFRQLLLAPDFLQVNTLRRIYGLEWGIENSIISAVLYHGILVTGVLVIAVALYLAEIARDCRRGV